MKNLYHNSQVYNLIQKDIDENMLNHSYMLISNDKEYVEILAKCIAMHILCNKKEPCFECDKCLKVLKNEHADVVILPNEKKNIQTDDIDNIVSESYVLPLEGDRKIYILNSFDLATVQAQNKLLKTLEEPPQSVIFIITTTNENSVLDTVKSRCKKLVVPSIRNDAIKNYLQNMNINSENLDEILNLCDNNLTIALNFFKNEKLLKMNNLCEEIFSRFTKSDQVLHYSALVQEFADDINEFLNLLLKCLNKIGKSIAIKQNTLATDLNMDMIVGINKLIEESFIKVRANCNISAIVDALLLGILEVKFKCKK